MPPAKLRLLQASLTDKSSQEYQRLAWEVLQKTINGHVNKVNTARLPLIIRELFKVNIVRGHGLLSRGIIQAQTASPSYTPVYAALISVINTKFPQIGELIVKHLISSFRRQYQQNDKSNCLATARFIAHLCNQNVLHEIVLLQILVLLLENTTDDSVELAIEFLKECGQTLSEVFSCGFGSLLIILRNLLDGSTLDERIRYLIEDLFAVQEDQFKAYPAIPPGLDLVDENDQDTHMLTLDDPCEPEAGLDVFQYDDQYVENEENYKQIRKTILKESSSSSSDTDEEGSQKHKDDMDGQEQLNPIEKEKQMAIYQTEIDSVTFRRSMHSIIEASTGAKKM